MRKNRNRDSMAVIIMTLLFLLLISFIHWKLQYPLLSPSAYNSYTLQAMAWRAGRADLGMNYPHLELAIFQGRYFVSFPPVPSIPIYFLSFLFADQVPDGLLIKGYAFAALIKLWYLFRRNGFSASSAALWAFMMCFASSMLPLLTSGAVWYQAQVLAFLLMIAAIASLDRGNITGSLILFALAVGCRPPNVLFGPMIISIFAIRRHRAGESLKTVSRRLMPGILIGMLIAVLYGMYNFHRFRNPFEFGHNYLPEFSFQGGTQFSLSHLGGNVAKYLLSLPFEQGAYGFQYKSFGFSFFLANPILMLMIFWFITDMYKKRMMPEKWFLLILMLSHLFFLLLHRTFGGFQYGARYAVDLIPYAVLYLLYRKNKKPLCAEMLMLFLGLVMSVFGSLQFAIF